MLRCIFKNLFWFPSATFELIIPLRLDRCGLLNVLTASVRQQTGPLYSSVLIKIKSANIKRSTELQHLKHLSFLALTTAHVNIRAVKSMHSLIPKY